MALGVGIFVAWVVLVYGVTWALQLAIIAARLVVWLALAIGAVGCLIYMALFDRPALMREIKRDRADAQVRAVLLRERWS